MNAQTRNANVTLRERAATVDWFVLVVSLLLPVAVGVVSSLASGDPMTQYGQYQRPPLSPPGWLFPVAWTILYLLMGGASYLVYTHPVVRDADKKRRRAALVVYGLQLAVNFVWSPVFFAAGMYWVAFGLIVVLVLHVIALTVLCYALRPLAAGLLAPYVAWLLFATYLNLSVAMLN